MISALRGRCPRPLDDRGMPYFLLPGKDSNLQLFGPEPNDLPIDLPGKRCQSSKAADPPALHYPMPPSAAGPAPGPAPDPGKNFSLTCRSRSSTFSRPISAIESKIGAPTLEPRIAT